MRRLLFAACLLFPAFLTAEYDSPQKFYEHGLAMEKAKRMGMALAYYEAAAAADPSFAAAFRHLGDCQVFVGNKPKALEAYRNYLKLKPGDAAIRDYVSRLDSPAPLHGATGENPFEQGNAQMTVMGWTVGSQRYNLYMSPTSGGKYRKVNTAPIDKDRFLIEKVILGKRYYFVLTCLTSDGAESKPSQEFSIAAR